jgi:hypothetical protein
MGTIEDLGDDGRAALLEKMKDCTCGPRFVSPTVFEFDHPDDDCPHHLHVRIAQKILPLAQEYFKAAGVRTLTIDLDAYDCPVLTTPKRPIRPTPR